jgi:uncharacterized protein
MPAKRNRLDRLLGISLAFGLLCAGAWGQVISLDPPGQRDFILDRADLITPEHEQQIRTICDQLLTERATPIIVVTIESMASCGAPNMRIETFATVLFNQWGIGHEEVHGEEWNTGILFLVSEGDRKARIELGATWGHDHDQVAQQIMDDYIVPKFKAGDFSGGILLGVESLDKMARGLELPTKPIPWWHIALVLGGIGLAIFTIISLIRRGASGWAWLFWGAIFAVLGVILYNMLTQSSRGGGGGFSGGSFGGGFSGGGGATGSW